MLELDSSGQMKAMRAIAALIIGVICLCLGLYACGSRILFLFKSSVIEAQVVEVRHEDVPSGRGSVLAYVPIVRLPNASETLKVDTYDKRPVYALGLTWTLRCEVTASTWYCTDPSLFYLLVGPVLWLLIGAAMLANGFYLKGEVNHPEDEILSVIPNE